MKNVIQLFICILTVISIPVSWAGDVTIPNTFTSGTPAVASQVNANFTAVETEIDDNAADITINISAINAKQDSVTGTCPAGQAIRVINVNGTVTCEVDSDSGGDITGVSVGDGLAGGGTSGAVTISLDVNPAFRATKSANQAFASTVSDVVSFGTEVFDSGGNYNPSTSTFLVPVSGFYQFTCTVLPTTDFTGNARLSVGGDLVQVYPPWPAYQNITVTTNKYFAASTNITCNFFDNSAAGNTISTSFSRFTGFLIR